jgi:uncharacterized protein YcbK (DUF882 family)
MARISCALVAGLQRIRDHVSRPVTITSGYRSYQCNIDVYRRRGATPTSSQHSSGRAADIAISGMRGIDIAKLAMELCGTEMGVGVAATWGPHRHARAFASWTYSNDTVEDRRLKAEIGAHRDRLRTGGGDAQLRTIVEAGRYIKSRYGYRVSEHPDFGGVTDVHTKGSYHYKGLAIDVNSRPGTSPEEQGELNALAVDLRKRCTGIKELLYRRTSRAITITIYTSPCRSRTCD